MRRIFAAREREGRTCQPAYDRLPRIDKMQVFYLLRAHICVFLTHPNVYLGMMIGSQLVNVIEVSTRKCDAAVWRSA